MSMSRSYPYLWIARNWDIDYGVVLNYNDALTVLMDDKRRWPEGREERIAAVRQSLNYWQCQAVHTMQSLNEVKRRAVIEFIIDARQLWRLAQTRGIQAVMEAE